MEPSLEAPQSINVRERLIEATIRILAEDGPSAVKARTVASASGLSTMVLYTHFGGVPELLAAVIDQGFRKLADAFSRVEVTDDPVADLCSMALTTRQQARANPHLYDLMFGRPVPAFAPDEDAQEIADATFQPLVAGVQRCLDAGVFIGDDAERIAFHLWAMSHGMVSLELAGHLPAEDADTAYEEALVLSSWPSRIRDQLPHNPNVRPFRPGRVQRMQSRVSLLQLPRLLRRGPGFKGKGYRSRLQLCSALPCCGFQSQICCQVKHLRSPR